MEGRERRADKEFADIFQRHGRAGLFVAIAD